MLKSKRSVSVVLAGYNEGKIIYETMNELYEALSTNFENFELILIDDASRDDTLIKMQEFEKEHDYVKVLPNYVNLNFGASIIRGLCYANNDFVIFNACDLPLSVQDMVKCLREMKENVDVLVLERMDYKTTIWRAITSFFNKIFLRSLFPFLTKGTPVLNYVQIYKKAVIPQIIPLARSPIFVWPELIFRAKLKGFIVKNIKVKCNISDVRRGAFGHPHDIIWGLYDMVRFRIRLWCKNI